MSISKVPPDPDPSDDGWPGSEPGEITALIANLSSGDERWHAIMPLVHWHLRRLAISQLRKVPGTSTLSPTVLVSELFIKLTQQSKLSFDDRRQFFALAARVMRHIVTDHMRIKLAAKRGGPAIHILPLDEAESVASDPGMVAAIGEALEVLGRTSPQQVTVVECRFFMGLTDQETAQALGLTYHQVQHLWRAAKSWLAEHLRDHD